MIELSPGKIRKRTWGYCLACKASTVRGRCPKCGGKGQKRIAYEYSLLVTENGQRRRERKQFPSRAEAQDGLDARKEELRKPKAPDAPTLTLSDALSRCLELKARRRSVAEYKRIAEHLKAAFGPDTPLTAITADRVSAYKAQRLATKLGDRTLSPAAVNRPLALLRHVLRLAKKWKVLSEVPEIDLEKEPQGRLRWLTPEEAGRLLDACRRSRNAALVDLVEFTLFTGLRRGEALALTWDRVDRARGVIRLEVTKSGHRREVPLNANADAVLARRWSEGASGYVFGTRNWNSFRTAWERAVEAAKLDDFRFHDLRHTFASWLVQRGRTLKEVQEALGHRTIAMTMRYSHLAPDHLRAAVAALDGVLPVPAVGARVAQEPTARREKRSHAKESAATSGT